MRQVASGIAKPAYRAANVKKAVMKLVGILKCLAGYDARQALTINGSISGTDGNQRARPTGPRQW